MKQHPYQRLKHEREQRGWSQAKVAEEVGIDPTTVSRWERGISLPYPYYREKLCALFGKTIEELGLLPSESTQQQENVSPEPSVAVPLHDPAVPFLLAGSLDLVGRDDILDSLKQQLSSNNGLVLAALHGLPGVGKTAIATHLAHEKNVLAHFPDGILWAGLGPTPNVLSHLSRWGTLLGLDASRLAQEQSEDAWAHALHAALNTRRMLVVIDDAWTNEEALCFKVGGPQCACLLTTRFPHVALSFAPHGTTEVHELNERESIALLSRLAPQVGRDEAETLEVVHAVGGLPLALTLMGKYLRVQAHGGNPRRIHAAMMRLRDAKERLSLNEPHGPLDRHPSLSGDTPFSLHSVIAVSDQHLEEHVQTALRALSVFPAKPKSFSEEAALAVCCLPVEVLDALCDGGLLEGSGPGRYMLHQTITDYAQAHMTDSSPFRRLVEYAVSYVTAHEKDYDALEQESDLILTALQRAFEQKMYEPFVQGITHFVHFLMLRGLYTLAELHLRRAYQVTLEAEDHAGMTTTLLHLGEIALRRGAFRESEEYTQEGVSIARQRGDHERLCQLLTNRGKIARRRGDYGQAEASYREGLVLAKHLNDLERVGSLLTNLGAAAYTLGQYQQAEAVSQEALSIATRIGHRANMSALLTNLGSWAYNRGEYRQAEGYYQEALLIARQIDTPERIGYLITCLGSVVGEQGDYKQAEGFYQEGMTLLRQHGTRWRLSTTLSEWGEVQLKHQHLDAAWETLREALDNAPEGDVEAPAMIHYNMARVAVAQGNLPEARHLGEASLRAFETIGHRMVEKVKPWMDQLPLVKDEEVGSDDRVIE